MTETIYCRDGARRGSTTTNLIDKPALDQKMLAGDIVLIFGQQS
jgi:hypothetical protein